MSEETLIMLLSPFMLFGGTLLIMGLMWINIKVLDWIHLQLLAHKYAKEFPHNIKKINDEIGWRLK